MAPTFRLPAGEPVSLSTEDRARISARAARRRAEKAMDPGIPLRYRAALFTTLRRSLAYEHARADPVPAVPDAP